MAFNGFLPAVKDAQRKGQTAKRDPLGKAAFDASIDLTIALQDRDLQRSADRYAGGDRDRLHEMWMGGELMAIYEREAIASLRRCGKNDLLTTMSGLGPLHRRSSRLTMWAKRCEVLAWSDQSSLVAMRLRNFQRIDTRP